MTTLVALLHDYGLAFLFLSVLLEQAGVPLPAYPVLLITGALAAKGEYPGAALLVTAVAACLIADALWYAAGARYGRRILRGLCRISLSPDGCVRQTDALFARFGAPSLMVAKFIPGFATIATALAGAQGVSGPRFLLYDAVGATLWAGTGLLLGGLFASAIEDVLGVLAQLGKLGGLLVLAAIALYLVRKGWQRQQFQRRLRMSRITVDALVSLIENGTAPPVLDVRSAAAQAEGRIPGAIALPEGDLPAALDAHPREALVVTYCDCPNDASAALAARRLMALGYRDVRPLRGGLSAWLAAGWRLERPRQIRPAPRQTIDS